MSEFPMSESLTRETLKPLMLKAFASLAGRPFDHVIFYMNTSHECGGWLTDFDSDLEQRWFQLRGMRW